MKKFWIIALLGQPVPAPYSSSSLNVEGIAPGAYLLQVRTAQGVATQRVVLQ